MRIFLVKLGVFLMIIAGGDFIIGSCMDYILANTVKGDYGRNNYISLQSHQSCLIFGSSRAIHHYNPDTIAHALNMSCYNCGEDGMGIITMFGRYLMIRQRYVPKLIIYDVVSGFDIEKDEAVKILKKYLREKSDDDDDDEEDEEDDIVEDDDYSDGNREN